MRREVCLFLTCLLGLGEAWLLSNVAWPWNRSPPKLLKRRTPLAVHFPVHESLQSDSGEAAALLSPLVAAGRIRNAQQMSETRILGVRGFSGWLSVNESCGSSLYFWYFPPTTTGRVDSTTPLILWLQGGPGGSSMFGLFEEVGPYKIVRDGTGVKIILREEGAWTRDYGVVFVDNPVGTGFSFTERGCYAQNQDDVGRDLYAFLQGFYGLFPALKTAPFYISGESYAGKYIPTLALKIHQENPRASAEGKIKIPLAGVAIGDGFSEPVAMMTEYAPLLYYAGLLDEKQRDEMNALFARSASLYNAGAVLSAFRIFDEALNGDMTPFPSFFTNATGSTNYFNYLLSSNPPDIYPIWLDDPNVRKLMHTGNKAYHNGTVVEEHMLRDFLAPITDRIKAILEADYKVLFYNGNLDVIVGTTLTEKMLRNLEWSGAEKYRRSGRRVWKLSSTEKDVAGYVRRAGNLWQVAVRNGGHILPRDQPKVSRALIKAFIQGSL